MYYMKNDPDGCKAIRFFFDLEFAISNLEFFLFVCEIAVSKHGCHNLIQIQNNLDRYFEL